MPRRPWDRGRPSRQPPAPRSSSRCRRALSARPRPALSRAGFPSVSSPVRFSSEKPFDLRYVDASARRSRPRGRDERAPEPPETTAELVVEAALTLRLTKESMIGAPAAGPRRTEAAPVFRAEPIVQRRSITLRRRLAPGAAFDAAGVAAVMLLAPRPLRRLAQPGEPARAAAHPAPMQAGHRAGAGVDRDHDCLTRNPTGLPTNSSPSARNGRRSSFPSADAAGRSGTMPTGTPWKTMSTPQMLQRALISK